MKIEKILPKFLFIFGIVLFAFSFGMLVYQIYHTITFDWNAYSGKELHEARLYFVIEYITIVFKLVISSYAIYSNKSIDAVVNPLFLFSILYLLFVILQTMSFFYYGAFKNELLVIANTFIDLAVATVFIVITVILKIDDWKAE